MRDSAGRMHEPTEPELAPYLRALNDIVIDEFAALGIPQQFWPPVLIQPRPDQKQIES